MKAVLVCTHGRSAAALVQSAEMICGQQDACVTVPFNVGESPEQLTDALTSTLAGLKDVSELICLTDLKGGTPFNTLVMLKQDHSGMEIVTGVNVPMLLQLFIQREQLSLTELVSSVVEAGVDGIYRYEMPTENADEEF